MTYIITINGQTTTTRSPKAAYKLYDQAVNNGQTVERFVNSNGSNLKDR